MQDVATSTIGSERWSNPLFAIAEASTFHDRLIAGFMPYPAYYREMAALNRAGLQGEDLAAVGVTNQRETAIVWDRRTGRPFHNAIVWQDTRTAAIARALDEDGRGDVIREKAGLPLGRSRHVGSATYKVPPTAE